jgi:hypothetical protein
MNFRAINKEYEKLKCPDNVFNPCKLPLANNKYFVICTERSVGKTTNVLLWSMIANKLEQTLVVYLRQFADMIERKNLKLLFNTIKEFGYIEKITGGKYKDLQYYAHGWYYCNYDDDGKVAERSTDPFMVCLSVDQNETYKSTFTSTKANIIIFDEAFGTRYPADEFIRTCDVIKTVIRERQEPIIFFLGNTIDRYHQYFYELELNDIVATMPLGQHCETITSGGTPIYVDFYSPEKTTYKHRFNSLFFGFKNKKLGAITGNDWTITPMPHPVRDETREIVVRNFFILYEDKLIQLEVCRSDNDGTHIICHFADEKKLTNKSVIYSTGLMLDWRYRYKFGFTKADHIIWTIYDRKKFFYASNAVGAVVEKYVKNCKEYRNLY